MSVPLPASLPEGAYPLASVPPRASRNKLSNLQLLAALSSDREFSVPPTHVLTDQHFIGALDQASPGASLYLTKGSLDPDRAADLRERLLTTPLPAETQHALQTIFDAYNGRAGQGALCLRSCFELEDLPDCSFAGTFETVPFITSPEQLLRAAQIVYASVFSSRAVDELNAREADAIPAMSLAVQPMIGGAGWLGGVAHTQSPDLAPHPLMLISVAADAAAVTSGSYIPEDYTVHRERLRSFETRAILQRQPGTQTAERFALCDEQARRIAVTLLDLEEAFGTPLEVEWLLDPQQNLHLLQARPAPIPSTPLTVGRPATGTPPVAQGIAVGHGHVTARIYTATTAEEALLAPPGSILVTNNTDPEWVPAIRAAAAVVTRIGASTSHVSRTARETGVPAVVGVGDSTDALRTGREATVFCAEGMYGAVFHGQVKAERLSPATDEIDIDHLSTAFSLARSCRPGRVNLHLDALLRPFRLPPVGTPYQQLQPHHRRRIAGYPSLDAFVRAKLLEFVCLTGVAFPEANLYLTAPNTAPWEDLVVDLILAADRDYGLDVTVLSRRDTPT